MITCPGCLAEFKKIEDVKPQHPYIGAVAPCWDTYSEILAKEFSDSDYFKAHRITVDSYCAQHIGNQQDRRARQSANLHLIALYLYFERHANEEQILSFLRKMTIQKTDWPIISQPVDPHWLTVHNVLQAQNAEEHFKRCIEWGKSVWEAYSNFHHDIIKTYENFA